MLGGGIILLIFGWHIVPPSHTGWMLSGQVGPDPVQYWLGWTFFRTDEWRWPPGLSPRFGLEAASSIFYADAIPLLAILLKATRSLLRISQYWGIWIIACGALQGWLAWRLIGLATDSPLARWAGSVLFVLQPLLINRLGGHFALGGQWLILWGLWLALTPGGRWRGPHWAALLLVASLVHAYILPMVAGLWAADAWRRRGWAEVPLVPAAGVLGLWLAGFFALEAGHGAPPAYGGMQMDLLAPFDPGHWGSLLPQLPRPGHPEVGGSYLGLGALLLLPLALWAPRARRLRPLALVLLAMLAFAITHRPSLGGLQVTLFPLPLADMLSALRASERYWWPVAYALMLAGIAGLVRLAGGRRAGIVLLALAALQAWDLRPGYARIAHHFPPTPATIPLRLPDPRWAAASVIRAVPAANQGRWWEEIAVVAATHGAATDAIYLARADPAAIAAMAEAMLARLREARLEPGTLYVLRDEAALAAARVGRLAPVRLDGLWVVPSPETLAR